MQYIKNPLIITGLLAHAILGVYMTAVLGQTGGMISRIIGSFIGTFMPSFFLALIPTLVIAGILFLIFGRKKKKKFINYFAVTFLILSIFATYHIYSGYKYQQCMEENYIDGNILDCM